jgi:hypothetical protein
MAVGAAVLAVLVTTTASGPAAGRAHAAGAPTGGNAAPAPALPVSAAPSGDVDAAGPVAAGPSLQTVSFTKTSTSATGNQLSPAQASFNGTTGGWVGVDATLAWASTPSTTGQGSLSVTATGSSWAQAYSALPPRGTPASATPGGRYAADAAVYVTGAATPIDAVLVFFASTGKVVGTVFGQAVSPAPGAWATLPEVAGVAPSSATSMALGVIAYAPATGQQFFVSSPALVGLSPNRPAVVGPLHTSGNRVVQANGQPVALRGVVLTGLQVSGTLSGTGVTEDAVAQAKAWGANFVRLPLGEQFWLSSNCDYVAGYQSAVDQVVKWITSRGMVALLDLHTNTVGGCTTGKQHDMADAAQAPTFWSQVAARYGNPSSAQYSPLVAFDLYNEPHDISDAVWLNGGTITDYYAPNATYQAAGMQQLYDAVRSAGAPGLVFVSGNNWANTVPAQLVSGKNVVYAVHAYTCQNAGGTGCTDPSLADPSPILSRWVTLGTQSPVVVSEFGWPSIADGTYVGNVIAYAQAHGWGWSAFAWQQANSGWALATYLADGTAEPNPSGDPVLLHLAGAA